MREMGDVDRRVRPRWSAEAVPLLSAINTHAGRLSRHLPSRSRSIEGQADDLHDAGLKALYQDAARRPTRWPSSIGNEIYDHLEKVVDRFEDVANEISGIVIEKV